MTDKPPLPRANRLVWVGLVFLALGLAVGFVWPVETSERGCGVAFHENLDGYATGPAPECDTARAEVRGYAVALLLLGGVGLGAAWVVAGPSAGRTLDQ